MDVLRVKVAAAATASSPLLGLGGADGVGLVDVDASASLGDALATMRAAKVTALAVYGQTDHWVGAGSTNVCTASGKLYIGLVSILDIILTLAARADDPLATVLASTRIVSLIGSNAEGQSLWVGNPAEPLARSLEPLAKGVHRFLVPLFSQDQAVLDAGAAAGAGPGGRRQSHDTAALPAQYALISQSDVLRFLHAHLVLPDPDLATPAFLALSSSLTLADLGLAPTTDESDNSAARPFAVAVGVTPGPLATVRPSDPVLPALVAMSQRSVHAVPVVADGPPAPSDPVLARPRPLLLGTLSSTDFRLLLDPDAAPLLASAAQQLDPDRPAVSPMDLDPDFAGIASLSAGLGGVSVAEFLARVASASSASTATAAAAQRPLQQQQQTQQQQQQQASAAATAAALEAALRAGSFPPTAAREALLLAGACFPSTPFAAAVRRVVEARLHRLWVVDERAALQEGVLVPVGVVGLGDMIRAVLAVSRVA
ncbi:hypothetical protein HK405_014574 [Cladochytrium tenue]|nr:hypothetical protein HK405_014574 [Cladochytrium tenue]